MVRLFVFLLSFTAATPSFANVLFEGYSKINSGGVPVGYAIARYEFDEKKSQFIATTLVKTGSLGSDVTESLRAVSDKDFNPIAYSYTSIVGKKTKTIDAKFKKGHMDAIVNDAGKQKTIRLDLPKDTFLSSILVYKILNSKDGLTTGENHTYTAIAEEDAELVKDAKFSVGKKENRNGFEVYKVLNEFKGMKFVSYVTDHGEVLETSSPANSIDTEVVAKPADAVGAFGTSPTILKALFGEVPQGTNNVISKMKLDNTLNPPAQGDAKKDPSGK